MRNLIVAGNWKMNGTKEAVAELVSGLVAGVDTVTGCQLMVFPPAIYLPVVQSEFDNTGIRFGAQTVSEHDSGAYTGELASSMLKDFGVTAVIVGHSERRALFGETNEQVAQKFVKALGAGLQPILCVGETQAQREAGETWAVIEAQLAAVLASCPFERWSDAVVAYEPVWAIGTGLTASPEQAQAVHAQIREYLSKFGVDVAQKLSILYGGSVKSSNAAALFQMPDIDGGLVGGASLNADEFIKIGQVCNNLS